MKIAIVYESIYSNTAAVAQAIAEGLRPLGDVDVRTVGDESFDADMLLVGAPTHVHGLPSSKIRKANRGSRGGCRGQGEPARLSADRWDTAVPRASP